MALGVEGDRDLSRKLGQSPSAAGNWRARGTVPYSHCVSVALELGLSLDWLLLGRGLPTYAPRDPPARPTPPAQVAEPAPREPPAPTGAGRGLYFTRDAGANRAPADARLAAILRWWTSWWQTADEDERSWALVQLRRAIPESAEPIARFARASDAAEETTRDGE